LEIIDNLGKIADTTVQLTETNGFIFTTDDGDLAACGLLITDVISGVPAFSGTGLNAIAIGQVTPNMNEAEDKCLTGLFFRVLRDHCGVLPLDVWSDWDRRV
jgi:hypothetical protein